MNHTARPTLCSRRWPNLAIALLFTLILSLVTTLVARAQALILPFNFNDTSIIQEFSQNPTNMAFAPDGRIFVTDSKAGAVRIIKDGELLPTPFATVQVRTERERGLIGIALDPNFTTNGYVYVRYTAGTAAAQTCTHTLARFTAQGDVAAAGSFVILATLGDCLGEGYHNSGSIHFGADGKLYTTLGDQGTCSPCAQTLDNPYGKILRFNPDGTIPPDNPFYNTTSGSNQAIWAYGMRNPFVFAIQPGTGTIFINDTGEDTWEEINVGTPGANFGWPLCEGACATPNPNFTDPIYAYGHDEGCAITGGAFYNPPAPTFPSEYVGKYFFADWCGRWIRTLDPATGAVTPFASNLRRDPIALGVGPDGALHWLGSTTVHKIQYSDQPAVLEYPMPVTVNPGERATFRVFGSGNTPLRYQWQRDGVNITGATNQVYSFDATVADNNAQFRAIVSNPNGSVTSKSATLTVRGAFNVPPVGSITQPAANTNYRAGDTISYSGTGSDAEDGTLPPSAFSWDIDFHHDDHFHDFAGPIDGVTSGSFTVPTDGERADNVWYRIHLTVRDSAGETHSSYVDVLPLKSTITLATDPPGLQVTLDGQPVTGPHSVLSVENLQRTLGVLSPQTVGDVTYQWVSWSDGGEATHTINVPSDDQTYTAVFAPITGDDLLFADSFEAGNLNAWPGKSLDDGDLMASPAAALIDDYGMLAQIDDNNALAVVHNAVNGQKRYRARFYFDPNSIVMAHNDFHNLFRGFTGSWPAVFEVDLRFYNSKYQVRASILNDGSVWRRSLWFDITDELHFFEIDWQAASVPGANNGSLTLWIDGFERAQLPDVDNDTRQIDLVRLGAISGIDSGTRGVYYFDAFESRSQTYIGPAPNADISTITLETDPPGLQVTMDGVTVTTPHSVQSPEGQQHLLGVVSPQTVGGVTYEWVSWSDGGDANHAITVPTDDQTYTAVYRVVGADLIFADDFETGDLLNWPLRSLDGGDLAALPVAALEGSYGMQAQIDDNNALAVGDDRPDAEKRYRARFHFDLNSMVMEHGNVHELFRGFAGTWPAVLEVQLRFYNGKYQVRAGLLNDATTWRHSVWFDLTDEPHAFELDWQAATAAGANDGSLSFWIDGVLRSQLEGIDNDTRQVDLVRWGAISSIDTGTRGAYYFDAFESRRLTYIGPDPDAPIATTIAASEAELHAWTEEEMSAEDLVPPQGEEESEIPQIFLPWTNR